jgi:two-component system chemotaxis sensor kinase CheA
VDADLIALLLKCGDHMLELIDVVASRGEAC